MRLIRSVHRGLRDWRKHGFATCDYASYVLRSPVAAGAIRVLKSVVEVFTIRKGF